MFNQQTYEQHLTSTWLGKQFYFFKELDSTNTYVKKIGTDASMHGAVILADHQTGGRGQHQRKWTTEPGTNLTFSLVFEPKNNNRFTLLTLACALAISEYLHQKFSVDTQIKWPNDILHQNKKLCGILTETQFSGNKLERIVVGIGLNVNQVNFGDDIRDSATSLANINSQSYSREKLLASILTKIEYYYRLWNQHDAELLKKINSSMIGFGEWVKLSIDNQPLDGTFKFLGINESGAFTALNEELDVQTFAYEQIRVVL